MYYRPGVSAVHSLPVPYRLAHVAFMQCVTLSLCLLLKLNDDDDDDIAVHSSVVGRTRCIEKRSLKERRISMAHADGASSLHITFLQAAS